LKSDGTASCFGNLDQADGSYGRNIPSALPNPPYVQVAAGNFAIYALKSNGDIDTWGRVFDKAVGPVEAETNTLNPPSCSAWKALPATAGFGHSCGATTSNSVSCWGADYGKQVSDAPSSLIASEYLYPTKLQGLASPSTKSVCFAGANRVMVAASFVMATASLYA
jgi:hypothetical protein